MVVIFAHPRGASLPSRVVPLLAGNSDETQGWRETPHYEGPNKMVTVREISAYLRVHPTTIYRLLKRNQIPAFHLGSGWRFDMEAIARWRLQQKKPGN